MEARAGEARACLHCGLQAAAAGAYCCFGCELAARVSAEGEDKKGELYGVITFSLLLSMIVMMLSLFLFAEDVYQTGEGGGLAWMRSAYRVASAVLSTPVVLMLGVPLARRAARSLAAGKLSMDLLVAIGAAAAHGLSMVAVVRGRGGVYFDSATSALVLVTLGRYLEASARARASRVIAPSLQLGGAPVLAARPGEAEYRRVGVAEIAPGMRVSVDVEEVLPVDVRLVDTVEVTLGVLTGAAAPVTRQPGDEVPAGAVPVSGPLHGVAIRAARESTLERLAALARSLKERPSRLQRLGDVFASALVPLVAVVALVTLATTAASGSMERAVIAALAVVLAACPCTYGVATPLVLWLALRRALESGVCIRSAATMEELASVKVVAFDKTGTLTDPHLTVRGAELRAGASQRGIGEIMEIVAALEAGNKHPVGRALAAWAASGGGAAVALSNREVMTGRGVRARDAEGRALLLGSGPWIEAESARKSGPIVGDDGEAARVVLARDGEILAIFRIGEAVRAEAAPAVAELARQGVGALMLTGDTEDGASAIAGPLGIEARAALSPVDKLEQLARLGGHAAMVGDGLNDAPALAGVGPGFAMEGGTSLARGMAQVTLLRADLRLVPWTLALARRTMQVGWQNLIASTIYNLVFLGLAASGMLRPVWAGISMLTSSLLTLASSLRVSAFPAPEIAPAPAGEAP